MKSRTAIVVLCLGISLAVEMGAVSAQQMTRESETLSRATRVLNDFTTLSNQSIPTSMLNRAEGIVIVPQMIKLGAIASVRKGHGVAVMRDENRAWRAPVFVTLTGGGVGLQAGIQSSDLVLVFNTRNSVDNLMRGKFTVGGNVSAAAGPVGREASAGTDSRLQSEIYSYSRARGLFAGVEVNGSVIQLEALQTQQFYQAAGLRADGVPVAGTSQLPLAAAQLLATLQSFDTGGTSVGAPLTPGASAVPPAAAAPPDSSAMRVLPPGTATSAADAASANELEATRQQLEQAARKLATLLDESWRTYLSLPAEVFSATPAVPTAESLQESLQRFERVAQDAQYAVLQNRVEFQQAYGLLRNYVAQVQRTNASSGVSVPPPPTGLR